MRVGETGCHRTVSRLFSRSKIRHCSGSRSGRGAGAQGRAAAAARRVSVCAGGSSSVSQLRVIAGGRRGVVDLGQAACRRTARPGLRAGGAALSTFPGRVVGRVDQPVGPRRACTGQRRGGDEVLGGRWRPAAGVPPGHDVGPDVLDELPDLRRGGLVDAAAAPLLGDPVSSTRPYALRQPSLTRADTTGMYSGEGSGRPALPAGRPRQGRRGVRPMRSQARAWQRPVHGLARVAAERCVQVPVIVIGLLLHVPGNGMSAARGLIHHRE